MPTHFHAIVWIDHSQAKIFHVGLSGDDEMILHPRLPTRHLHHKANSIGSGHAGFDKEFFGQVLNAISDAGEILIIGPTARKPNSPNISASSTQKSVIGSSRWKPPTIPASPRLWLTPGNILTSLPREGGWAERQIIKVRTVPELLLADRCGEQVCARPSLCCGTIRAFNVLWLDENIIRVSADEPMTGVQASRLQVRASPRSSGVGAGLRRRGISCKIGRKPGL